MARSWAASFGAKVLLAAGAKMTGDIMRGALEIDTETTFEGAPKRNANALADAPAFSAKPAWRRAGFERARSNAARRRHVAGEIDPLVLKIAV